MTPSWSVTAAGSRAALLVVVPSVCAVVFGRVDLAILAAPFVIGLAVAVLRRPAAMPALRVSTDEPDLHEGAQAAVEVTVTNPEDRPYDMVVVRLPAEAGITTDRAGRTIAATLPGSRRTVLTVSGTAEHWGRPTFGRVDMHAVTCDGLLVGAGTRSEPLPLKVFPRDQAFDAGDAMPRAAGLIGAHHSRTYGDGGELADIRRYAPGDRLRQIDWRTSLRSGELHVVQTLSDRDADIAVVLDVLHQVEGSPSVLDTTVHAAQGISEHYLGRGDRVTLLEYGGRGRVLRAGTGPRHRVVSLEWLVDVRQGEQRYGATSPSLGRGLVSSRALVIVLTPLLDERSLLMLASLARARHAVVAVNTLPHQTVPANRSRGRWADAAHRLWWLERQNSMGQLLEHGVPVVPWAGSGSLDHVLRTLSRMAASR